MIKTIDDIIKLDTKWLIHFLKENHVFKQYYKKLYNVLDKENKPFSLKDVMNKKDLAIRCNVKVKPFC